jgi:nitroreductase
VSGSTFQRRGDGADERTPTSTEPLPDATRAKRLRGSIKRRLPRRVVLVLRFCFDQLELVRCFLHDYRRYRRHFGHPLRRERRYLEAHLLRDAHRIEKGLALPAPRPFFGAEVTERLVSILEEHGAELDGSHARDFAQGALRAYLDYHEGRDVPDDGHARRLETMATVLQGGDAAVGAPSGIVSVAARGGRTSVRRFARRPVAPTLLRAAVARAIQAPSVCNRQHWRVHLFDGATKRRLLTLQNGNTGFGDDAPVLAVITSRLSSFLTPYERYQQYVDGGMFAMCFLEALHASGLGACPLNWSASVEQDRAFHALHVVPPEESVIMYVVLGHYDREAAVVAASPRMPVENFVRFHGETGAEGMVSGKPE